MTNNKQITMTKNQTSKPAYDLEERTYQFAKAVRLFDENQNKSEEAKESAYWLRLINETNKLKNADEALRLIQEANGLKKIFSSILKKSK
jgi:hypothetical protein